jgi:trk system potassium uptake protein TrkA
MKVIIIGQGKLVYFLAKQFISKGYYLTIINQDMAEATVLSRQLKATVMVGDGSNPLILKEAGAYQTDVLLSLMSQDPDNLVACQIAQKHYGVPRTIALVNDPEHQQVFEQLGITVAFSPIELLANLIEQQTDFEELKNLIPVAEGKVTIAEIALDHDSPAVGKTLQELELSPGTNGTKLSILVKAARERGAGGGGECILKFLPTLPVLSASFSLLVKLPAPGASTTKKTLIFVTFPQEP